MEAILTKVCCRCGTERLLKDYYADCSREDGLHPACKYCCRTAARNSYYKRKGDLRDPEVRDTEIAIAKAKTRLRTLGIDPATVC